LLAIESLAKEVNTAKDPEAPYSNIIREFRSPFLGLMAVVNEEGLDDLKREFNEILVNVDDLSPVPYDLETFEDCHKSLTDVGPGQPD
jgi:hypothetical protein